MAAGDNDVAAGGGRLATADTCTNCSTLGIDGAALDEDIATGDTTADARSKVSARGVNGTTQDNDIATGADIVRASTDGGSDARTISTTNSRDVTALDDNVATLLESLGIGIFNIASADARTAILFGGDDGAGRQRARTLYGERLALGNIDARIVLVECRHGVRTFEHDGGVVITGDARPAVPIVVVRSVDGSVTQRHLGTVGHDNPIVEGERVGEHVAILRLKHVLAVALVGKRRQVYNVLHGSGGRLGRDTLYTMLASIADRDSLPICRRGGADSPALSIAIVVEADLVCCLRPSARHYR